MCREAAGREEKEAIAHHNDPAFQALHGVSMGVPCETDLTEITSLGMRKLRFQTALLKSLSGRFVAEFGLETGSPDSACSALSSLSPGLKWRALQGPGGTG